MMTVSGVWKQIEVDPVCGENRLPLIFSATLGGSAGNKNIGTHPLETPVLR